MIFVTSKCFIVPFITLKVNILQSLNDWGYVEDSLVEPTEVHLGALNHHTYNKGMNTLVTT